jgi:Xaa-Pro aminopeptidase
MTADHRAGRLERVRAALAERDTDALLLGPSADYRWLLGYEPPGLERLTMLIVSAAGDDHLVVPALEAPLAIEHLGDLGVKVLAWQETEDPIALVVGALAAAGSASRSRLAVGDHLFATFLLRLQAAMPSARYTTGSVVTGPLRRIKDQAEIDALARAGAAIDAVVDRLGEWVVPGRAERDVAADLDVAIRAAGHEQTNFTIVGSGPNGASPHHIAGHRVIQPGDAVVIDIGGRVDGYCSDTTRTLVVGEPPEGFAELYEVLRTAQAAGCDAVRPGVTAASVDAACRDIITEAGYGEYFIHRTGHGIGLEEHEDPYIVAGNDEPLSPGMAFSVEPGIYLPGRHGARIEDIVVCTEDGGRRLNTTSRELRVLS